MIQQLYDRGQRHHDRGHPRRAMACWTIAATLKNLKIRWWLATLPGETAAWISQNMDYAGPPSVRGGGYNAVDTLRDALLQLNIK